MTHHSRITCIHAAMENTSSADSSADMDYTQDPLGNRTSLEVKDTIIQASAALMGLNLIAGIISNVLMCSAVIKNKNLHNATNYLLVNLSVAGIINCTLTSTLLLIAMIEDGPSDPIYCHSADVSDVLSSSVQLISVVSIGFERYQAIASPFDKVKRNSRIRVSITASWFIGILGSVLYLCFFEPSPISILCTKTYHRHTEWKYDFGLYFIVPMTFVAVTGIFIFYILILYTVRKHFQKKRINLFSGAKIVPDQNTATRLGFSEVEKDRDGLSTGNKDHHSLTSNLYRRTFEKMNQNLHSNASGVNKSNFLQVPKFSGRQIRRGPNNPSFSDGQATNISSKYSEISPDAELSKASIAVMQTFNISNRVRNQGNEGSTILYTVKEADSPCSSVPFYLTNISENIPLKICLTEQCDEASKSPASFAELRVPSEATISSKSNNPAEAKSEPHSNKALRFSLTRGNESTGDSNYTRGVSTDHITTDDTDLPAVEENSDVAMAGSSLNVRKKSVINVCDMEGQVYATETTRQDVVGDVCVMSKSNRERGKRRVEAQTAKRTVLVIVTFLMCWLPFPIVVLLSTCNFYDMETVPEYYVLSLCLAIAAATVNPLTYGLINRQIRIEVIRIVKRCRHCTR